MGESFKRCDLHVHSKHSGPADLPVLRQDRQLHVNVFDREYQHEAIARKRLDPEAFFAYLAEEGLPASVNHPVAAGLRASRVFLGGERLAELRRLFPVHRVSVRCALWWRYYVFNGEA